MPKPQSSDDRRTTRKSGRPVGHDKTRPAGDGDPGAPHGRPGDKDNKGGSKDPQAPHNPPAGK